MSDPAVTPDAPTMEPGELAARMASALTARHHRPAAGKSVFASDLTVGDLILLDEVGYEPVDLVFGAGAASWNPQAASAPGGSDAWAWALTTAITTARGAIDRELRTRSAAGVVAMQLGLQRHPGNLLTCTMLGTAIQGQAAAQAPHHVTLTHHASLAPDPSPPSGQHSSSQHSSSQHSSSQHSSSQHNTARPARRGSPGPFSTTLSVRDFHLLTRAGYRPVGITVGAAVVGFPSRSLAQGLGLSRENRELEDQTTALYAAREQAMGRLDAEARALDADGVVAVEFSEHPFNSVMVHAVELLAVGTAIVRGADGHRSLHPSLQLSLDDPAPDVFQRG